MARLTRQQIENIENALATRPTAGQFISPRAIEDLLNAYKELTEFENPKPVVVALLPTRTYDGQLGLLTVRRNIPPGKGALALPGGYLEIEDWREGLSREIWEELGVRMQPEEFRVTDVVSGRQNQVVLIFARAECELIASKLDPFCPNHEVSERVIITRPCELAFPAHTESCRAFFDAVSGGD